MYYLINPDLKPNYLEIKNNFFRLKQLEQFDIIPETNILVSNNRYCHSRGSFFSNKEKYLNKIVSIFLIQKKGLEKLVGPILISDDQTIPDILTYINHFVPGDNVYVNEQEDLDVQINKFYGNNSLSFTNDVYK